MLGCPFSPDGNTPSKPEGESGNGCQYYREGNGQSCEESSEDDDPDRNGPSN